MTGITLRSRESLIKSLSDAYIKLEKLKREYNETNLMLSARNVVLNERNRELKAENYELKNRRD